VGDTAFTAEDPFTALYGPKPEGNKKTATTERITLIQQVLSSEGKIQTVQWARMYPLPHSVF
jgi:hypothetical protein